MTRKKRRLVLIGSAGTVLAAAAALILVALSEQIVFFRTPSDIVSEAVNPGDRIRLGGLVADGSVERGTGTTVRFAVTDTEHTVDVVFTGVLPDLFREGQGVVAEGILGDDGSFVADTVLAKHDENYMPREVADALKDKGHWQGETQ